MKKAFLILFALIIVFSCSLFNPPQNPIAKLELVQLSSESLSKAFTDDSGQLWFPKSELSSALQKTSEAGIYFGNIKATRTLQYVIMNIGDIDVYDVNLRANDLIIYPNTIDVISASEEGNSIGALPIINIVKEHVIPVEGVGVLQNMEVGSFTDTLILNYSYNIDSDTSIVGDNYIVNGQKMGVILDWFCEDSTFNLMDYFVYVLETEDNKGETRFLSYSAEYFDKLIVVNNGSSTIDFHNYSTYTDGSLINIDNSMTLTPGDTLNVGHMFSQIYSEIDTSIVRSTYNYLEFGPSTNIIKSLGRYYFSGWLVTKTIIKYSDY